MANDPVCGLNVNPKTSEWLVEHRGEVFHFCTSVCRDKFVENPHEFTLTQIAAIASESPSTSKVNSNVEKDEATVVLA